MLYYLVQQGASPLPGFAAGYIIRMYDAHESLRMAQTDE